MVILNPSEATRSIEILQLEAPTSLTIVAPDAVTQGVSFNIVGLLLRTDTNVPVPGAMITISYNGTPIGNVFTDDLGRYLVPASINIQGTWVLRASFAGSTTLAASSANFTTRIGALGEIGGIGLLAFLGASAYLLLRK